MFDFGDGAVSIYSKAYCTDDYGVVVATANRMLAALEYARDTGSTIKFFSHQGADHGTTI